MRSADVMSMHATPIPNSATDSAVHCDHGGFGIRSAGALKSFYERYHDALMIFALALCLRLVFSAFMANTFDEDEFVYLALGRDMAHGAVPYRDFTFFHPPGILTFIALLNPITSLWWPLARLVDVLIDSFTAILVLRAGKLLFGRSAGLVAAAFYAVTPVVLVSAIRVDQEVLMTAFMMLGVNLLLGESSHRSAILAGICLALACWIKYPMLVFLPMYFLIAPRRFYSCLLGFAGGTVFLFAPYLRELHALYNDTVTWQLFHRPRIVLPTRIQTTAVFWVGANPLAAYALLRLRGPRWLLFGFATGSLFVLTSAVYPHYFVPVEPFAAILTAPLAIRLIRLTRKQIVALSLSIVTVWALILGAMANKPGFVLANRFSEINPIVQLIDRSTSRATPILGTEFAFAFLSGRPWLAHYFWNDYNLVTASFLERKLNKQTVVVMYPEGNSVAFPSGLTTYLDSHETRIRFQRTSVWRASSPTATSEISDLDTPPKKLGVPTKSLVSARSVTSSRRLASGSLREATSQ
jgi:Dolichyl-phosphate-mannose-protein mannosyltransferase